MKFVILSHGLIPDYGVRGPVLTPRKYDLHQVLRWISMGVDIREVMEDGSYRKLTFIDERIANEIGKELDEKMNNKKEEEKIPDVKKIPKKRRVDIYPKEEVKEIKIKKEEPKKEEKEEVSGLPAINFPIDTLEKPE